MAFSQNKWLLSALSFPRTTRRKPLSSSWMKINNQRRQKILSTKLSESEEWWSSRPSASFFSKENSTSATPTTKNEKEGQKASVSGWIYRSPEDDGEEGTLVRLFTKEGCTLCDKVVEVLRPLQIDHPHSLQAIDITDKEHVKWWDKYKYDIPVLHIENIYWTKHRLSKEEAIRGLSMARDGLFVKPNDGEPNAVAMERKKGE